MKKIIFNLLLFLILFPLCTFAQGTATDPSPTSADGTSGNAVPLPSPDPASISPTLDNASATPASATPTPKVVPRAVAPQYTPEPMATNTIPNNPPETTNSGDRQNVVVMAFSAISLAVLLFFGLKMKKKDDKNDKKCANIKKLMEDKLNELTDLKGQLKNMAKKEIGNQIKNQIGDEAKNFLILVENANREYERLKELYEKCIISFSKTKAVFIFHGTEGYPEENWFPWLKGELEAKGCTVFVPQFPSPPGLPAKITEWFEVLKNYEQYIDENTIFIGHSLGGVFALRLLEQLKHPVGAVFLVGTPIGIKPIANYDRDSSFSGFDFNWVTIKNNSKHFTVYQSDNDPYVSQGNGEQLAKELGVELTFIPNAGHFNKKAGYTNFPDLLEKVRKIL